MSDPNRVPPPRALCRRGLLRAGLGASVLAASVIVRAQGGAAAAPALPRPRSLRDELAAALAQQQPLVVLASLEGCPHCELVRQAYLGPMRSEQRLPVVQVDLRLDRALDDFDGRASTHDRITRAWRVAVAPTVLFFGPQGKEVAARMVGSYLADFYGAYLQERLTQARAALKV
jgi:hypothetical protein